MSLKVCVDIDRTLYNTVLGVELQWRKIAEMYPGVDSEVEVRRQAEFYVYAEISYYYDLSAHVADLGLDVDEVYQALVSSELADGRLQYKGADELMSWLKGHAEVFSVTYGKDDIQRLKASLCPALEGVEIITTLGHKADYLRDQGEVWLVDDKTLGENRLENVKFIQVAIEGQPDRTQPGEFYAKSLSEALEILQKQ